MKRSSVCAVSWKLNVRYAYDFAIFNCLQFFLCLPVLKVFSSYSTGSVTFFKFDISVKRYIAVKN